MPVDKSGRVFLVGSVPLLHPEVQTVDEMLEGWRNQQLRFGGHDYLLETPVLAKTLNNLTTSAACSGVISGRCGRHRGEYDQGEATTVQRAQSHPHAKQVSGAMPVSGDRIEAAADRARRVRHPHLHAVARC